MPTPPPTTTNKGQLRHRHRRIQDSNDINIGESRTVTSSTSANLGQRLCKGEKEEEESNEEEEKDRGGGGKAGASHVDKWQPELVTRNSCLAFLYSCDESARLFVIQFVRSFISCIIFMLVSVVIHIALLLVYCYSFWIIYGLSFTDCHL